MIESQHNKYDKQIKEHQDLITTLTKKINSLTTDMDVRNIQLNQQKDLIECKFVFIRT